MIPPILWEYPLFWVLNPVGIFSDFSGLDFSNFWPSAPRFFWVWRKNRGARTKRRVALDSAPLKTPPGAVWRSPEDPTPMKKIRQRPQKQKILTFFKKAPKKRRCGAHKKKCVQIPWKKLAFVRQKTCLECISSSWGSLHSLALRWGARTTRPFAKFWFFGLLSNFFHRNAIFRGPPYFTLGGFQGC